MSKAVPIGKNKKKEKSAQMAPQSLPPNFFKGYKPPSSPKINPQIAPKLPLPNFASLPPTPDQAQGINLKKAGSYSMKRNQHPMSMPVKYIMGPNTKFTPFTATKPRQSNADEAKEDASSLEKSVKKLQVGSFTCFDVLTSPLTAIKDETDPEDVASSVASNTASTFGGQDDTAPERLDDDEEDLFEME